MGDDGAAYEWCLNLTGWVSLSDGCAGHSTTARSPINGRLARDASSGEGCSGGGGGTLGSGSCGGGEGSGGYHKDPGSLAERALTQNFPRLRHGSPLGDEVGGLSIALGLFASLQLILSTESVVVVEWKGMSTAIATRAAPPGGPSGRQETFRRCKTQPRRATANLALLGPLSSH